MAFLAGLAAQVMEWVLTKLFAVVSQDYQAWAAQRKASAALASNSSNLSKADQSGDPNAIASAGQSSLNNDGGV